MSQAIPIQSDENQVPKHGKSACTIKNQKRAALGVITNQINQQLRVQPHRAVKPKAKFDIQDQKENPCNKKTSKPFGSQAGQFSIFVDEPNAAAKPCKHDVELDTSSELTDAVIALPQPRVPLTEVLLSPNITCFDDPIESPMVLDVSSEDDPKPIDRGAVILTVPEYEEDIYSYLRQVESKKRAKPDYMARQQDITLTMRNILVDWLVEVSEEYRLHRETLFLAVNYIDRFLSKISVLRGKLQLVGAASMFLASKYEEIYPPDVTEFAYITDDTYSKQQILRMEHLILKVLTFDVAVPTTNWFCEDFLKACDGDDQLKSLTMFLAELTLIEMDTYLRYVPSVTAAACLCLARYTLGYEPWSQCMIKKTGYEVGHFVECLQDLHKTYLGAATHPQQAVQEKYKADKFHQVSDFSKNLVPHSLALLTI